MMIPESTEKLTNEEVDEMIQSQTVQDLREGQHGEGSR